LSRQPRVAEAFFGRPTRRRDRSASVAIAFLVSSCRPQNGATAPHARRGAWAGQGGGALAMQGCVDVGAGGMPVKGGQRGSDRQSAGGAVPRTFGMGRFLRGAVTLRRGLHLNSGRNSCARSFTCGWRQATRSAFRKGSRSA
jgi:hypothetical protein